MIIVRTVKHIRMIFKRGLKFLNFMRTAAEVPSFFLFFSFTLAETIGYNFAIFRSCYINLGYDRTDCEKLGTSNADNYTKEIEEVVQPYANIILMAQELVAGIVPAILCLFIGPWSDINGRRPVLITTMIGFCLAGVISLIVISVDSLSAWYLLGASAVIALFGGIPPFLTAIICYISDVTTEENRGFRMGMFEAVMAVGTLIGSVSTSYIFNAGGYIVVTSITASCFFLAFFYNIFIMVESEQYVKQTKRINYNIFSAENITELLKTIFRRYEKYQILILILAMIMSTIIRFVSHADTPVFYLFVLRKFDWDVEKYTLYRTFREFLRIVVTIGGITFLHERMNIREAPLIFIGSILMVGSMLLQGWASKDWHIYLAGVIRSSSGLLAPMVRSLISKLVLQDETGKVFSLTVAFESLILIGGIPLYTLIYNNTISTNPGAFNFLTAGFFALLAIFTACIMIAQNLFLGEKVFKVEHKKTVPDDTRQTNEEYSTEE